jgi:tetratricopeptide (TPR) repeat protein
LKTVPRTLVLLVAVMLGASRLAWAGDPAANRQEAKRLRDLGVQANDRGDFGAAIEDFRSAYALYPSPNLLYNLGVALDHLNRSAEAVDAFEAFLEGAPNAEPLARRTAEERVAELEPSLARLELVIAPADAEVTLGGRPIPSSRQRRLPVAAGEHTLTVRKNGFGPYTERVSMEPGEHRRLQVSLQAEPEKPENLQLLAPVLEPAPKPHPDLQPRQMRLSSIILGGVGVAALGVGVGFVALTYSTFDQLNHPRDGSMFDPSLLAHAGDYQAAYQSLFVVGSALVATTVVLEIVRARTLRAHHAGALPVGARGSASSWLTSMGGSF